MSLLPPGTPRSVFICLLSAAGFAVAAATAQPPLAAAAPTAQAELEVGPPNVATADPSVPRPATTPCVVSLFTDLTFANFTPKSFAFVPPADCPGPWAKVVFEGDFSVTAGRQFDRTANIWIGATAIYFGTTQEPSATVSPS